MSSENYSVEWSGKTYSLGQITAKVKNDFVAWLKTRALKDAREFLDPMEYINFRQEVFGGSIFWNSSPSMAVAASFGVTDEGRAKLAQLLMGESGKGLSEADVLEMIEAKEADESSDYFLAMALIWENADPKAKTGSAPLPVPAATADTSAC